MVSIHWSIACVAVLGTGLSASAGVVSGSQTFYNMSASSRTYTYYQYAPVSGGSGGSVMNGSVTTRRESSAIRDPQSAILRPFD